MNIIEKIKLKWNEIFEIPEAAVASAEGVLVPMGADQKMVILLTATASTTATIKAGDGIQATEDIEISLESGKTAAVSVESGKFLITTGENKGNILVIGENIKVQAIELP